MKTSWKIIASAIVIIVVIAAVGYYYYTTSIPASPNPPIKIGVHVPLTGAVAWTGDLQAKGGILAMEEINEAGGVLGRNITLVIEDDEYKPETGVSVVEKMITSDKVDVVTGGISSVVCLACMDVTASYNIPYISVGPSSDAITDKYLSDPNKYRGYFRLTPLSIEAYGESWVVWLKTIIEEGLWVPHTKKYAIIVENTDFGRTNGKAFDDYMFKEMEGWELVALEIVSSSESNFYEVLTKIKTLDPSILLTVQTSAASCASLTTQFLEKDIKALFLSVFVASQGVYKELAGEAATGVIWNINNEFTPKLSSGDPATVGFNERFKKRWGEEAIPNALSQYETIYLVAEAYKKAGSTDPEAFIKAMESIDFKLVDRYIFEKNHYVKWGFGYRGTTIGQIWEGKDYTIWPAEYADKLGYKFRLPPWL